MHAGSIAIDCTRLSALLYEQLRMSYWDVPDVVEWMRMQNVPAAGLIFAYRHGIDGETMDESVDLIVKDLSLPNTEAEIELIKNWRSLSESGLEPEAVLTTQTTGATVEFKGKREAEVQSEPVQQQSKVVPPENKHMDVQEVSSEQRKPWQSTNNNPWNRPMKDTKVGNSHTIQDSESNRYVDDFEETSSAHGDAQFDKPPYAVADEEESIPDETPAMPVVHEPSIAESVATDIQPILADTNIDTVIAQQTKNYAERKRSKSAGEQVRRQSAEHSAPSPLLAPEVSHMTEDNARREYETALQKQGELLRLQQERIRLQSLMIERQREQLQQKHHQQRALPDATPYDDLLVREQPTAVVTEEYEDDYPVSSELATPFAHPTRAARNGAAAYSYGYSSRAASGSAWQDSVSMLSDSEVFDNGSADGNGAYYGSVEAAQPVHARDVAGAAQRLEAFTQHHPPLEHIAEWPAKPAALMRGESNQSNVPQVDAGHTPARGEGYARIVRPGLGGPGLIEKAGPNTAQYVEAAVEAQPSVDSAGMVWYRKPAPRPKSVPTISSSAVARSHFPVPPLNLASISAAEVPAEIVAHQPVQNEKQEQRPAADKLELSKLLDVITGLASKARSPPQAHRPISAPSSRRRPTFVQTAPGKGHVPAGGSQTARARLRSAGQPEQVPAVETVHQLFDTARDEAIAQIQEWQRQQLLAENTRPAAPEQPQQAARTSPPRAPPPERSPYGPNGVLWADQLRQYDKLPAPQVSPGRRPPSARTATKAPKKKAETPSKFSRLIAKLTKQYNIDPTVPETADPGFNGTGRYNMEEPSQLTMDSPPSARDRKGKTVWLLETGSGTIRDGPTYLLPLKRSDEEPLYPHYSPRRPASSRPGSRSGTAALRKGSAYAARSSQQAQGSAL